ncbi:hypothetical protein J3459_010173 [Metarhizium acridum]|nr:hypothetical protein J3459_010173 [Metarhizium acridum]
MDVSVLPKRDGDSGGLSLGGLLAIALCGSIVIFTSLGLFMAWRVKVRQKRTTERMYTMPDEYSQTRLTKRPLVMTESAVSGLPSRLSSRFSLTLPPIIPLPPMLSYNNLNIFRSSSKRRAERKSWINGEEFHGPTVKKDSKDGWFSRDSWIRQVPTVPNVRVAEEGGDGIHDVGRQNSQHRPSYEEYRKQQQQHEEPSQFQNHPPYYQEPQQHARNQQPQAIYVQKRRSGSNLPASQTTPNLSLQDDVPRGRQSAVRTPAQAHVRPSVTMTEMGLRDILRSTDQRLREGSSRSPVKHTPQPSPTRTSPVKTPSSRTSNSGRATGRHHRGTPSPGKPGNMAALPTQASVASIGSVANSLIAQATQELELPDGTPSPSRVGGREWEPQGQQILPPSLPGLESPSYRNKSPQRSPQRSSPQKSPSKRRSVDSDESSSLSTLYSVGEPESEEQAIQRQYFLQQQRYRQEELQALAAGDDPFTNNGRARGRHHVRQKQEQPAGPRPLRRTKTMSPSVLTTRTDASLISQPLRPLSVNSKSGPGRGIDLQMVPPRPLTLGASRTGSDGVAAQQPPVPEPQSDCSFTSDSVGSDDSEATALLACETPKPEWVAAADRGRSPTGSPLTPGARDDKDADLSSSSPFSEQEILSMLLASGSNKRALPQPPAAVAGADGSILSTGLSPRPSVRSAAGSPRRRLSGASSYCSLADPAAVTYGSPSRLAAGRFSRDAPALGTTIAQLRRMNSVVSAYSAASSVASTAVGEADSPTLPGIFTGQPAAPRRQLSRREVSGSRHYLNIGKGSSLPKHRSMMNLNGTGFRRQHRQGRSEDLTRRGSPSGKQDGKENQGVESRASTQADALGLREVRQSPSRGTRDRTPPTTPSPPPTFKLRPCPVGDLLAREKRGARRDSAESLGLYDKDGFLLPSPEREARTRGRALRI